MASKFPCPNIGRRHFEPYESPVGEPGRMINTRKERERDLVEHGCVDTNDLSNKGQTDNAKRKR